MPLEGRVEAQAKLNLRLRVLAREDSGYHQIETLFCRIALSDSVSVRVTDGERALDCSGERLPAGGLGPIERNLAWRAAVAYADATGFPAGFRIGVEKRIPVGGGLGGGSADAGAVLRILNTLNPTPLPVENLLRLAASLGSDVPFLTQDAAALALAWGRGERMLLLPPLPTSAAWLLVPDVAVNTAEAYRWIDQDERTSEVAPVTLAQVATWRGVSDIATNDFEAAVSRQVPVVERLLSNLRQEAVQSLLGPSSIVVMSGSGSTVAIITGEARPLQLPAPQSFGSVVVVETETSQFVEPVVRTH